MTTPKTKSWSGWPQAEVEPRKTEGAMCSSVGAGVGGSPKELKPHRLSPMLWQ